MLLVRRFCTKKTTLPILKQVKEKCYEDIPDYDLYVNPHLYGPVEKFQTIQDLNVNSLRNIIQSIRRIKKK